MSQTASPTAWSSPAALSKLERDIAAGRPAPARAGYDSSHIIVADAEGNVVTGTSTINALPWGDGLFVGMCR